MAAFDRVVIVTDGSGDGTGTTRRLNGYLESIKYKKTDYAAGCDFTVVGDLTDTVYWSQENVNATATVRPRGATHTINGVAAVYAAAGEAVLDRLVIPDETLTITVAQGGDTKTGTFLIAVA